MTLAQERANNFIAELRGLPDEDCPNPDMMNQSMNRVRAAQRRVLDAIDELAQIVAEEREKWDFRPDA